MMLLKQSIWSSPFLYLGIFFLIAGIANLLYKFLNVTKSGFQSNGRSRAPNWIERNRIRLLLTALIVILILVVGFIMWLNNV